MSDLWAEGAEEGKKISLEVRTDEGHEENPITTSVPIFMLGHSKGGYCHPCLLVTALRRPRALKIHLFVIFSLYHLPFLCLLLFKLQKAVMVDQNVQQRS